MSMSTTINQPVVGFSTSTMAARATATFSNEPFANQYQAPWSDQESNQHHFN